MSLGKLNLADKADVSHSTSKEVLRYVAVLQ